MEGVHSALRRWLQHARPTLLRLPGPLLQAVHLTPHRWLRLSQHWSRLVCRWTAAVLGTVYL